MSLPQSVRKDLQTSHNWFWIGWKTGGSFLSKSCSVADVKPITFWLSNEKLSIQGYNQNKLPTAFFTG